MRLIRKLTLILNIVLFLAIPVKRVSAQDVSFDLVEETLEAKVIQVLEEKMKIPEYGEGEQLYQKLRLLVTKGSLVNKEIVVESGNIPSSNLPKYETGDKLLVLHSKDYAGNDMYLITDYVRRDALIWLFAIFVVLTIVIAKIRGLMSLFGMAISFLVIFYFILPKISSGSDPVGTALFGSFIIIPVTFFFSHGFNKKTVVAIAGTTISLIITGILASIFVEFSNLTGFASEEAGFLQIAKGDQINIKGLLLGGIIIGVLGVLDDVTVSQSAIIFQLKKANKNLNASELFKNAMSIGQDHISSMVNTLVLVYTGASLPLLLLFINNPHPFTEVVNYEIIAGEVIRTLVGSIGLILAVPITTILASLSATNKK
ncbi:MAG: YibE/F family protein [bacterium]